MEITGGVQVGHDVTLRGCRIIGDFDAGGAGYTIKYVTAGVTCTLIDCEVLCRSVETKAIAVLDGCGLYMERTIVRGGDDNLFIRTAGNHFEGYSVVVRDSWFGVALRSPGSHSDLIQVEQAPDGVLIERCRIEGYSLPEGADPLTEEPDGTIYSSGGVILTQQSTAPTVIDRVHLLDSYIVGGNYTVDTGPTDGRLPTNVIVSGCRFGTGHNIGAFHTGIGTTASGNVWAESGPTVCCGTVTAGNPVGG